MAYHRHKEDEDLDEELADKEISLKMTQENTKFSNETPGQNGSGSGSGPGAVSVPTENSKGAGIHAPVPMEEPHSASMSLEERLAFAKNADEYDEIMAKIVKEGKGTRN